MSKTPTVTRIEASLPETQSTNDRLINCTKFNLLGVEYKGNRKYRISFAADTLNASTDINYAPEEETRSEFETALQRLTDTLIPKCFPNIEDIEFVKLSCSIKNNSHKEPQHLMQLTTITDSGFQGGFKMVSKQFSILSLPAEYQSMLHDLELIAKHEIENRHPEAEQMSLLDAFSTETDEYPLVD